MGQCPIAFNCIHFFDDRTDVQSTRYVSQLTLLGAKHILVVSSLLLGTLAMPPHWHG